MSEEIGGRRHLGGGIETALLSSRQIEKKNEKVKKNMKKLDNRRI